MWVFSDGAGSFAWFYFVRVSLVAQAGLDPGNVSVSDVPSARVTGPCPAPGREEGGKPKIN